MLLYINGIITSKFQHCCYSFLQLIMTKLKIVSECQYHIALITAFCPLGLPEAEAK